MSLKSTYICILTLLLIAECFHLNWHNNVRAQTKSNPVFIDRVISEPMAQTMPILGRIIANESGVVATRIAERIKAIKVKVGARVRKGDVLALMSSDQLKNKAALKAAELKRVEAKMKNQFANLQKKQQARKRILALRGSSAFRLDREQNSQRDLEMADSSLKEAEAEVLSAQSSLEMTKLNLNDAIIRAPYPGIIIATHKVPGNYARIGDPIVTILNDHDLEIEADIPTVRAMELAPNTQVRAKLQNGTILNALVRVIIPQENLQTRTLAARFTIDKASGYKRLAGNQSVTMQIPIGQATRIITVHKDAILINKGQKLVYVVKTGKADIRPITIGRPVGERFEVLKGLKPGDDVITRGNERLRPGEAVTPVN